ncbi:heterokaryon incompatibility protein-domain-containing protein [Podospora conica]|nr:heterokaryon incompatibility protein-domain-containing protein [Schizothecium conicum]
MRLINTDTLELSDFYEPQLPIYAILSHTWEKDELTLREWIEPSTATTSKAGYKKVCMAASLARRSGLAWLWADTVCIDKTSSAELSEAINSMFNCNEASICYAFLADVSRDSLAEAADGMDTPKDGPNLSQFRNSRWFTRGWTLQELIAPRKLFFYSREWALLGSRASFASDISSATGIDRAYLGPTEIAPGVFTSTALGASVATRMSWLAKRRTTRIEDMAYCMLGLFDINMPLLYGEGHKAFLRLQEEIIRVHDDQSIFAWNTVADATRQTVFTENGTIGFLATTPRAFECARPARPARLAPAPSPYTMTNAGLSITLPLARTANGYIAILSAERPGDHANLGVFIRRGGFGQMSRTVFPSRPLLIYTASISRTFSLLFTQTRIHDLQTSADHYYYAAFALRNFPRVPQTTWYNFANRQETRMAVSNMIRERNEMVMINHVDAMRQSDPISALRDPKYKVSLQGDCQEYVEFGCCDMGHPEYEQLRLVHIGWPPEPTATPLFGMRLFSKK